MNQTIHQTMDVTDPMFDPKKMINKEKHLAAMQQELFPHYLTQYFALNFLLLQSH